MSTLLNLRVEACLKSGEVVFGEVAKMDESELVLRIRELEVNKSPPHINIVKSINQDDIIQIRPIGGHGHRVPAERDPAIVVAEEVNGTKTKNEPHRLNNNPAARGKIRNFGRGERYQPEQRQQRQQRPQRQQRQPQQQQQQSNRTGQQSTGARFFSTRNRSTGVDVTTNTTDRESRSIPRRISSRVVANEMLDNNVVVPIMCPPRDANAERNRLPSLRNRVRHSTPGNRRRENRRNSKGIQYNQDDVYDLDQDMQSHVEQDVFGGLATGEPHTSYERERFYDFLNRHPPASARSTRDKQQKQQQQSQPHEAGPSEGAVQNAPSAVVF